MKSKYYVRLMRPTFQRAILMVEAGSEEAAMRSAVNQAEQLSEAAWAELETETQQPVLEMVFSKRESAGDSEADVLEYVRGTQYAYALLQAGPRGGRRPLSRTPMAQGFAGISRCRHRAGLGCGALRGLR